MRGATASVWLITAVYLGAVVWIDRQQGMFALSALWSALPLTMGCACFALCVRYVRWHWLLTRAGHRTPAGAGLVAYLTGFAFTATPGKVGELARIRYFRPLGVGAPTIIAAFVYERALDVVVVLILALPVMWNAPVMPLALGFAVFIVGAVAWIFLFPQHLGILARVALRFGWIRIAGGVQALTAAFTHASIWRTRRDLTISLALGMLAWSVTAGAFALLLNALSVDLPVPTALALYPTAMLAGAASMLPGGLGSTEAVLIALLVSLGAAQTQAMAAAVGIRLSTLWLAIVVGLLALLLASRREVEQLQARALQTTGARDRE